jgi:membrane-associated phospholipid phosphatase
MSFLTDFADQGVMLPLAVAMAVSLWLAGWPRAACAWTATVTATFAVIGAMKLAVFVYGPPAWLPSLLSPSGHTASAALVYGGSACLLAERTAFPVRALLVAGAFAGAIGFTRVALTVHTAPDVLAGAAIGIAGALILSRLAGERPRQLRTAIPLSVALSVLIGFHGLHIYANSWLHQLAEPLK